MPATALAFALAAACLHALWNVLLACARDIEAATAVALLTAEVVFAPVPVLLWRADGDVWPWLLASALCELAYFALLAAAYRAAPLSVVYPVARGSAPVLVLAVSVLVLGHATSWQQVVAVCVIVLGVVLVRGIRGATPRGVALGLAVACCIAAYTLVDNRGIELAAPVPYLELVMAGPAVAWAAWVAHVRGRTALRAAVGPASLTAGIATFAAYAFVLAALDRASAASVAAVRESSVVVAVALAVLVLREPFRPGRLGGAVLVVAGIALLAHA
jgi:drug/metabolite transporter (DMT)-like permease